MLDVHRPRRQTALRSPGLGDLLDARSGRIDRRDRPGGRGPLSREWELEWMRKAIEADQKNGTRFSLGQDHLSYAELLRRKGDLPSARQTLQTAAAIFTECGADGWVRMTEERLAKV